jgi:hypothetical protein
MIECRTGVISAYVPVRSRVSARLSKRYLLDPGGETVSQESGLEDRVSERCSKRAEWAEGRGWRQGRVDVSWDRAPVVERDGRAVGPRGTGAA